MIRYLFFPWAGITFALILYCLSDVLFGGSRGWPGLGKRLLLCLIWPLAVLSPAGRRVLFG
jgi:sugar phosphate permease